MKIAYILHHDLSIDDGVTKKVKGQIKYWKKLGAEVLVLAFVHRKGIQEVESNGSITYHYDNPLSLRINLNKVLINDVKTFNPSVIYYRYDGWIRTISYLSKRYPVVSEINTHYKNEMWNHLKRTKSIKTLIRYIFPENRFLSKMKALVTVTYELEKEYMNLGIPTITLPNAIDTDLFQVIKPKSAENKRKGLFFMGTPNQYWHGVDYIQKLANEIPHYDFHIVGDVGNDTENLFWHGYMKDKEYLQILKGCCICIGTLALYRKNMTEASPLKVREYIAYGYPVILGYDDTVFMGPEYDWLMKIDVQKGLDIEKIVEFVESNSDYVLSNTDIRKVSFDTTESKRIDFLEDIIKKE